MATKEDVQKLAELARIRVADPELEKFTNEFDAILAYVGQLESVQLPASSNPASPELQRGEQTPALHNVMREDGEPHESRAYTEKLAEQFPQREGDALSVKQIISHD